MNQQVVSITSQGQITIPAKYRRRLGLEINNKALIILERKKITIEPVPDFLSLGGSVKVKKKISPQKARQEFIQYLAKRKKR